MRQRKASNHSHVIISSYFLLCELGWTHFPSAWHLPVIILRSPTLSLSRAHGSVCVCVCVQRGGNMGETTTDGETERERWDELTHPGHLCQDKTNPESENHLIRAIADK